MQGHTVLPETAEMSALVQQLLIAQGGRYTSVVSEQSYKQSAVLMQLAAPTAGGADTLPSGSYLVVPWDVMRPGMLNAYLDQLEATGVQPQHLVVVSSRNSLHSGELFELGARYGLQAAVVDIARATVVGAPILSRALQPALHPDADDALSAHNPLAHMTVLADPRDPRVFFERLRRATPSATLTKLLIGANVLVFAAMKLSDDGNLFGQFTSRALVNWGANVGALTVGASETWRLLTCTFVHADLLHIGFNMYALKVLGDTAERLFGSGMFTALYLLSALGGSVASLAFTLAGEPLLPSVGASGAVFGVMGGLLGFALSRRGSVPPQVFRGLTRSAVMFIGINVAIGLAVSFIDNAAHLGGLGVGTVAGLLLSRDLPPAHQPSPGARGVAIVAVSFVLMVGYFAAANEIASQALRAGW